MRDGGPITLDEAKAAAHGAVGWFGGFGAPITSRNIDELPTEEVLRKMIAEAQEAIDTLATVAYNAGKVAGWDENVAACKEAQRKAAEGMRERAASAAGAMHGVGGSVPNHIARAIRALPLEEKP